MRPWPGRDTCYRAVNRVFITDDIPLPRSQPPPPWLVLVPEISWFPSSLTVDMEQACHTAQTQPHVIPPDPDILQM